MNADPDPQPCGVVRDERSYHGTTDYNTGTALKSRGLNIILPGATILT